MSRAGLMGVGLLLATLLTGCSDSGQDYCDALSGAKKDLVALADQTAKTKDQSLRPTVRILEGIRQQAPDGLRDEWDTVVFAYQDLADAVDKARSDAAEPTRAERRDLRTVAAVLAAPRVVAASRSIEDQASQVCGVAFTT